MVVRGGGGGWGNTHFTSSTNQAPRLAQKGEGGEEKAIILELRLMADVGIIGYPNVGKSTLLAVASAAKPKIAGYPFTTLEPVLGVVEVGHHSFVLAEIPGLIAGAHLGRGLGHDFLRHILRTKMLIHLIDGTSASPVDDMIRVNTELGLFDSTLAQKPQLVAVNKVDLPPVQAQLAVIRDAFASTGTSVLLVSAASGEGVSQLMAEAMERLGQLTAEEERGGSVVPPAVFRPQPRGGAVSVRREGDTLVVAAPQLERITALVDLTNAEVRWQLKQQLARIGVDKALQKAGVRPGDKVRCGRYQWLW